MNNIHSFPVDDHLYWQNIAFIILLLPALTTLKYLRFICSTMTSSAYVFNKPQNLLLKAVSVVVYFGVIFSFIGVLNVY